MRIAVIDKKRCIAPKECAYICEKACPVNRAGKECIITGKDNKPIISEDLCIGCGICVKKCPVQCISILNLPEELKSQALHRYSANGFKLFRTVVPQFGQAVGVLGQNGIGKTGAIETAINYIHTPFLIVMDGDCTYHPKDIQKFYPKILVYDQVIGLRMSGRENIPTLNRFGNRIINAIFNLAY